MFIVYIDTAQTWRGGQNQALLTATGLKARGHKVVLVAHPKGELLRRAGPLVDTLAIAPRGEIDLRAGWQLGRWLRQAQPDVVHANDPHGVALAALALSIGRRERRPALVAARRVDFHIRGNAFSQWKYRQVNVFVTASRAIAEMLREDAVATDRIVVVHEGVDIERIRRLPAAAIHHELQLPLGAPIVGNVAALVPHKGQKYFIDAAALVCRHVPDARFVILGEGELRQSLEKQVRDLHLGKHVVLPGFRTDVLAMLKAFDVFVMSSVTEGLGTSLLDAMSASRPIVATQAGGIPEVVVDGTTGLLVPVRDPARMADAITRMLRNPGLRESFGQAGLARVQAEFSVDRMVDRTIEVYRVLAGTSRATGTGGRRADA